jgi:PAS domain S-box-containing protein
MGEDTFRQITDHLAELVWLVDADFETVQYVNPAYESLVGRPLEDAEMGLEAMRSVHPDDRADFEQWVRTIRADTASGDVEPEYVVEVRIERPDGAVRWIETTGVPIRDGDGSITGFAGITTDLTETVERERALEERVERLDEFASIVSHDLRNPLAIAQGKLQMARETGDESAFEAVQRALDRIEDLTLELTELARHGDSSVDVEPLSLAEIARDAWAGIESRGATLSVSDAAIEGDPVQFRALFSNLFRNAVGHGGAETVRVGPLEHEGFFVEDSGAGIPEADRDRVFEHGFSTGYGGSGVGLTIVARIAEAHGFDVSLTDSDEGGARFEFRRSG